MTFSVAAGALGAGPVPDDDVAVTVGEGMLVPLGVLPKTVALKYTDWVADDVKVPSAQVSVCPSAEIDDPGTAH